MLSQKFTLASLYTKLVIFFSVIESSIQFSNATQQGRTLCVLISSYYRLLLLLHWLKHGDSYQRIASPFGISKSHACDLLHLLLKNVSPLLSAAYIRIYNRAAQREKGWYFPRFPFAAAVLDVTSQPTTRPSGTFETSKLYFDGKQHCYAIKSLTVHAANGLLMLVHSGVPGSVHDFTIAKKQSLMPLVTTCIA